MKKYQTEYYKMRLGVLLHTLEKDSAIYIVTFQHQSLVLSFCCSANPTVLHAVQPLTLLHAYDVMKRAYLYDIIQFCIHPDVVFSHCSCMKWHVLWNYFETTRLNKHFRFIGLDVETFQRRQTIYRNNIMFTFWASPR